MARASVRWRTQRSRHFLKECEYLPALAVVAQVFLFLVAALDVRDRKAVEGRACECYAVVKKEYDRLLPEPPAK